MNILMVEQGSQEWWDAKVGSIGGTRFGNVISTKKNRLISTLVNEKLNGYCEQDDYVNEDMQSGIDNEPIARQLYIEKSGINFRQVGMIKSDYSEIHHASPDGLSDDNSIVLEVKSTSDGSIHMERFWNGVEASYMPQIKNYFAVSDEVKEVHFVSYCPYRPERPLVVIIFKAADFFEETKKARLKVAMIEAEVKTKLEQWIF